ncbi:hypothetical protein IVB45_02305 [Bradyrhizobium sp. 4]|uniref:hypothetical protein n=1 Tax=Bradyrhizobium sp. 4 TaxID=2782678 RepID=UPI001FFF41A9|nr:hypothetical protein [Bradyrhizobium sp. 4]UPJ35867.1 hypothetical protein IVB45_02305 [Bradyrhizobium sp. 4]
MFISSERCLACGSRRRPTDLDTSAYPDANLAADGTFMGLPSWFCSIDCYKKTVGKYIKDRRYDFDKTHLDDEAYKAAVEDAYAELMTEMSGGLLSTLFNKKLRMSESEFIQSKVGHIKDQFYKIQSTEIFLAEVELNEHLYAEWQHKLKEDEEEREERKEKLVERIEKAEEKQRLAQEKEDEKQRKLDEEREVKEAEEERWRAKPFKL